MSLISISFTVDKFKIQTLKRQFMTRTFILALNIRLRFNRHLKLWVGKRSRVTKVTSPEITCLNECQDCVNEIDIDGPWIVDTVIFHPNLGNTYVISRYLKWIGSLLVNLGYSFYLMELSDSMEFSISGLGMIVQLMGSTNKWSCFQ